MTTLCRQRSFANISAELLGSLLKTHCDFSNKSHSDDIVDTVEDFANFLHSVATVTDHLNAQPFEKALVASSLPPAHCKLWAQRVAVAFSCCRDKHRQSITCERLPEPSSRVVQAMRHSCGKGPRPSSSRQCVPDIAESVAPVQNLLHCWSPLQRFDYRRPLTKFVEYRASSVETGAWGSSASLDICSSQEVFVHAISCP